MSNNIKWIALLTATFLLIVTTSAIMPDDVDGSDTYFEEGGIWYKIVGESEVEIANPSVASGSSSAPSTYSGNFVVPESVNHDDIDYSVIGIGYDAFNEANISSIDLPDSLEYIENRAFQGSTLTSISIPVSVTRIGFFFDDPSAIGNGSYGVFWNIDDQNPSPLKTIEFEGDRTKELVIGNGAFWNLEITSLVLPDGVTTIGVHAFEKCDKLESLNIPDSVSFIGYGAFDGCESLNELSIPGRSDLDLDEQDYFTWDEKCMGALTGWLDRYDVTLELGEGSRYTFDSDSGLLYAGTDLLGAINSVSGNVTIPDGITAIAPYAFANCVSITGISIPSTVAKIYENAFIGCDSLQTVNIANADVDIDLSSFMGSHSLQSLIIGGAEIIQNRMIVNDGVLVAYLGSGTSETIGDNITSIGQSAFEGNTTLKEVFIGNTVSSIGYYAFNDCSSLEK